MIILNYLKSAFKGTPEALKLHQQALQQDPNVISGLKQLQNVISDDDIDKDQEQPIFLLSAGWRSGSTLLQRLIMSDPRVLIWGEPFDECGMIQGFANTLTAFRPGWPPEDYFYDFHSKIKRKDKMKKSSTIWLGVIWIFISFFG